MSPNDTFNIGGTFYAAADSCAYADLTWDPVTRCASGTLCDPGLNVENWGVAIEFYFHDTGPIGSTQGTKSAWDATSAGAKGVAWSVTGTAPGLQVWLTQMAWTPNGTCASGNCAIQGPPWGTSAPRFEQAMLFLNVSRDDWGGTGTSYTFDPSQILALQFKLSARAASGVSFNYCVNELGIVR